MSLLPLSLVLSCPKHLAYLSPFSPAATFLLPTQSSAHNLFERARLRGSEKNKGIINGEEVRKKNFRMPRYNKTQIIVCHESNTHLTTHTLDTA